MFACFWGAHAPPRARFGALAETPMERSRNAEEQKKVAKARPPLPARVGACAPLKLLASVTVVPICSRQQAFHRLFPSSETTLALKFVKPVEHTAFQPHESDVRVMAIHHFAPRANRHSPCSFLLPGNLLNLQPSFRIGIKHSAAEQKQQRHFAVFERIKVFRGRDVQVERARDNQNGFNAVAESTNNAIPL